MKRGEQKRIPAVQEGSKQHQHIFGAYNWRSDQISWTAAQTKNSAHFITFLEHLLVDTYPTGRVVLVMDNAAYHKSAPSLAALSLFEHRAQVIWLPPYCSDLNPIERFWRHLKDLACANKLQDHIQDVLQATSQILKEQNNPSSSLRFHVSKDL
jgi:transposase